MKRAATVAIVNTSPDTVELLRVPLERAGFVVVSCFTHDIRDGRIDFDAFMRIHRPAIIAYDIAVPYAKNFRLYEHVRSMDAVKQCRFVLTSTNASVVQKLVGRDEKVYEVVDKDADLDRIIQAIKDASRARATR
jgi:DNA-binding NtrC family response regulator